MVIASAQTVPYKENIEANIADHIRLTKLAVQNGAQLILFPEMSLTAYERELAEKQAFSISDKRLEPLQELAADKNIVIVAGAPVKIKSDLFIGSFILFPDLSVSLYTKQYLHGDEKNFFKPGFEYNPKFKLEGETVFSAICADITNPDHPKAAASAGCSLYLASIFFSPNGIPEAHNLLSSYAKKYSMNVLMSNFGGKSWGMEAGGCSAIWDNSGNKIIDLSNTGEGLIIAEKTKNNWKVEKLKSDT